MRPIVFDDRQTNDILRESGRRVLAAYLRFSDHDEVFPSRRKLAEMTGLTREQVKYATTKLAASGLVTHLDVALRVFSPWFQRRVTVRHARQLVELHFRRDGRAITPEALKAWSAEQNSWGGHRHGTQRVPRRAVKSPDNDTNQFRISTDLPNGRSYETRERARPKFLVGVENQTKGPRPVQSRPPPRRPQAAPRSPPTPTGPPRWARPPPPALVGPFGIHRPGGLASGPGVADRHRLRNFSRRLVPPKPDADIVPTLRVPRPALLGDDLTDVELVEFLGGAYRSVLQRKFGMHSLFLARGRTEEHKQFRKLARVARHLRERRIAPVAWALFQVAAWHAYGRGKAPTPGFIWSLAAIAKHEAWFVEDKHLHTHAQIVLVPEHRALWDDWEAMMRDLSFSPVDDIASVCTIVDRWFPPGDYDRRLRDIKTRVMRQQRQLDDAVLGGKIPWWV